MVINEFWQQLILYVLAICGGITTICVAGKNIISLIRALKKPADNIKDKFEDYDIQIKELKRQFAFMLKAVPLLLQDDLVILEHLRTSNNTGKMEEQEGKVHDFLLNR